MALRIPNRKKQCKKVGTFAGHEISNAKMCLLHLMKIFLKSC
jgi:hypothetical protein